MQPDEIIAGLAADTDKLPRAAMQAALDDWDATAPRLPAMLRAYADMADRSDDAIRALACGLPLLG